MKVNTKAKIHIGTSLRDTVADAKRDIARFEAGETVDEQHIAFENWQALFNVLTPKRYELLQHLYRTREPSIRALSRALGRDFKRVHEDVHALAEAGLLEYDEDGLDVSYGAIETRIPLGSE